MLMSSLMAPSAKDADGCRHLATSREVVIKNTRKCPCPSKEFEGNTANMVRFIALFASHLKLPICDVQHASADGDRLIVSTRLGVADAGGASVVVGDDNTVS